MNNNDELILETCEPPVLIEMTEDEIAHERFLMSYYLNNADVHSVTLNSKWENGKLMGVEVQWYENVR